MVGVWRVIKKREKKQETTFIHWPSQGNMGEQGHQEGSDDDVGCESVVLFSLVCFGGQVRHSSLVDACGIQKKGHLFMPRTAQSGARTANPCRRMCANPCNQNARRKIRRRMAGERKRACYSCVGKKCKE